MNTTQQGILALLKSAVTEQPQPLPDGFDIEAAYPLILRHHMVTLAYDGAVRCGISPQLPAMRRLFQGYCKALLVSEGQLRELGRLFNAFEENGIDYMPLKGCNMKSLYPKPELRMMGDADVLIRLEQYGKIVPIMESLGFSARSESDHELVWQTDSLYLELHKRLIPSYNVDFHSYFGNGWQLAKRERGSRWAMTAEDTFIFLFTHFAKHYRDGGIGCRHVADLWVYLRSNPDLDWTRVYAGLERLKLWEFCENITRLLDLWFGGGPSDAKLDFITEFIFASGSWGQMEDRTVSVGVRDMRRTGRAAEGRLRYIWRTMFPGVGVLRQKYTVLQKAPWLLPVVWLVRPFYKLIWERGSLDRHKRAVENLTQEKLDTRHRMLNYVGLDYHAEL